MLLMMPLNSLLFFFTSSPLFPNDFDLPYFSIANCPLPINVDIDTTLDASLSLLS